MTIKEEYNELLEINVLRYFEAYNDFEEGYKFVKDTLSLKHYDKQYLIDLKQTFNEMQLLDLKRKIMLFEGYKALANKLLHSEMLNTEEITKLKIQQEYILKIYSKLSQMLEQATEIIKTISEEL